MSLFGRTKPPARKAHGLSSSNGKLYIFGGETNESGWLCASSAVKKKLILVLTGAISNDFYSWDPSSLEWQNLSNPSAYTPSPRKNFGMACVDGRLFVFGGDNGSTVLNDLYEYNISSREWSVINISDSGPTSRTGHGFASAQGNLYVFGGRDQNGNSEQGSGLWG